MLLSGVYVAILAVVAVASESDLVWDLVRIIVIVVVFFLAARPDSPARVRARYRRPQPVRAGAPAAS